MTGLLGAAAATLLVSRNVVVVTVAQVVLATFAVAVGVLATRLLHDCIPSAVRSSVASGVGAATWLSFLPLALVFGAVADRLGVHAAGWLLAAATAAAVVLLVTVTRQAGAGGCAGHHRGGGCATRPSRVITGPGGASIEFGTHGGPHGLAVDRRVAGRSERSKRAISSESRRTKNKVFSAGVSPPVRRPMRASTATMATLISSIAPNCCAVFAHE